MKGALCNFWDKAFRDWQLLPSLLECFLLKPHSECCLLNQTVQSLNTLRPPCCEEAQANHVKRGGPHENTQRSEALKTPLQFRPSWIQLSGWSLEMLYGAEKPAEPSLSSQLTESGASRMLVLCQLSHGVVMYLASPGLCGNAEASHCSGFFSGAQALSVWTFVVVALQA